MAFFVDSLKVKAFEFENFLDFASFLNNLRVSLIFYLCEIIIEYTLLFGFHYGKKEIVAHTNFVMLLMIPRHKIDLIVSHEFIEVAVIVLRFNSILFFFFFFVFF